MQKDFHYYATYCAAVLAGFSHEESLTVAYSAQLTDCCSATFLKKIHGPVSAATVQTQIELANAGADIHSRQEITRIWASFHFLPADLYAAGKKHSRMYNRKYRLICGPNGDLLRRTVEIEKGRSLQAAGLAMHVLADTWAHRYFAGTPSLVINNTNFYFYELVRGRDGEYETERPVGFHHSPSSKDDPEKGRYLNTVYQPIEDSVMNLGHGRAGHLPDYSFMRYRYMPAWGSCDEILKDNPSDYFHAFTQMIYALRYLKRFRRGEASGESENILFETEHYDFDAVSAHRERIRDILTKRQLDASDDWKAFGEQLSGECIPDFDPDRYAGEYISAPEEKKDGTFLGHFILAALRQKSMVTNQIFKSGNPLAGFSSDYEKSGLKGIKDYFRLLNSEPEEEQHE